MREQELRPPIKLREDGGPTSTRANIVAPACLDGGRNKGSRKNVQPIRSGHIISQNGVPG